MPRKKRPEKIIIEIDKSLTIHKTSMLYGKIIDVYKNSDEIEIDLKEIEDCDTAGLQLLHSLSKSSRDDKKELILKNPSPAVKDALNRMCISWEKLISR